MSPEIVKTMKKFMFDLISMDVVANTGQRIGKVADFVFDTDRGQITKLIVHPEKTEPVKDIPKDENGAYVFPINSVISLEDVVVIDLRKKQITQ
ncbi:MAG: PRC-barrel domain-containing protein [Candidatus Thermoplasmatota archaeon]|jgi:sporulation protein YlmC with PRC-barrel domain|nr:PRC-barrel domain-containing protein [Candidatus Thermoplasmatota archaeon]MCL5793859.1 PRC-barrel domain-containing protein [Candidatus Thermoplasmatota archaeon]